MNANKLADKLEECAKINFFIDCTYEQYDDDKDFKLRAATMLRQQQAELTEAGHIIGVLREYISDLENGLQSSINLNKAQNERK